MTQANTSGRKHSPTKVSSLNAYAWTPLPAAPEHLTTNVSHIMHKATGLDDLYQDDHYEKTDTTSTTHVTNIPDVNIGIADWPQDLTYYSWCRPLHPPLERRPSKQDPSKEPCSECANCSGPGNELRTVDSNVKSARDDF